MVLKMSVSLHCPSSFLLKAEFLIGALAAFSRTVKDRVAGGFMVVLSQPLKICSFASRTCEKKEEKKASLNTINTGCTTKIIEKGTYLTGICSIHPESNGIPLYF